MDVFEKRFPHLKWSWSRRKWFIFRYDLGMAISYLRTLWHKLVACYR
jgi:hypothetical protein